MIVRIRTNRLTTKSSSNRNDCPGISLLIPSAPQPTTNNAAPDAIQGNVWKLIPGMDYKILERR